VIAGFDTPKPPVASPTVAGPAARRSTMPRRIGCEIALNGSLTIRLTISEAWHERLGGGRSGPRPGRRAPARKGRTPLNSLQTNRSGRQPPQAGRLTIVGRTVVMFPASSQRAGAWWRTRGCRQCWSATNPAAPHVFAGSSRPSGEGLGLAGRPARFPAGSTVLGLIEDGDEFCRAPWS
jgi:hypothetical protein